MTAEVYELEEGKVLKLFYESIPKHWITYEFQVTSKVSDITDFAPKVYEVISFAGRKGIVYQKANGESMLNLINSKPLKIRKFGYKLARLHASIHKLQIEKLPNQKDYYHRAINESKGMLGNRIDIILDYLNKLPNGNNICHGDLHPDNIIMTQEKLIAIDWMNACSGNSLADVARTILLINTPYIKSSVSSIMKLFIKLFQRQLYLSYLKEYIRLTGVSLHDINEWLVPVAAARLSEKIPGEAEWLLEIIENGINK